MLHCMYVLYNDLIRVISVFVTLNFNHFFVMGTVKSSFSCFEMYLTAASYHLTGQ